MSHRRCTCIFPRVIRGFWPYAGFEFPAYCVLCTRKTSTSALPSSSKSGPVKTTKDHDTKIADKYFGLVIEQKLQYRGVRDEKRKRALTRKTEVTVPEIPILHLRGHVTSQLPVRIGVVPTYFAIGASPLSVAACSPRAG